MAYGQAIGVDLPTVSVTPGPNYANSINAFLEALQDVVEAKVTPAGFDMNSDLSFLSSGGTAYRAKDLLATSFRSQSATLNTTTYANSAYFANGNFYVNDGSGNAIQLTSGGALNAAGLSGITGSGYGSGGVEVKWDSGNLRYELKSGSGSNDFADLLVDDVRLNDGSNNYVTLSAQAMGADYTVTLPAAAPASTSIVTMASTGTLNTTRDPSVDTITTSGAANLASASVSGTLGVTGLITATAGLTAASNQHITVSGTGRFKHGELTRQIHAASGQSANPASNFVVPGSGHVVMGSTTNEWMIPLNFDAGERIISVYARVNAAGTGTKTLRVETVSWSSGTVTTLMTSTSTSSGYISVGGTIPISGVTVSTGNLQYYVRFDAGDATDILYGITVAYDRP